MNRLLRRTKHTAEKHHDCECCDEGISPGQTYAVVVQITERKGFEPIKVHLIKDCPELPSNSTDTD